MGSGEVFPRKLYRPCREFYTVLAVNVTLLLLEYHTVIRYHTVMLVNITPSFPRRREFSQQPAKCRSSRTLQAVSPCSIHRVFQVLTHFLGLFRRAWFFFLDSRSRGMTVGSGIDAVVPNDAAVPSDTVAGPFYLCATTVRVRVL